MNLFMSKVTVKNDITLAESAIPSTNKETTNGKRYTLYVETNSKVHSTIKRNSQFKTSSFTNVESNALTTTDSDDITQTNTVLLANLDLRTSGIEHSDEVTSLLGERSTPDTSNALLDFESEIQTTAYRLHLNRG